MCLEVQLAIKVNPANNNIHFNFTEVLQDFTRFKISVGEWDPTMTRTTSIDGWDDRILDASSNDTNPYTIPNLPAGVRYKVHMIPYNDDTAIWDESLGLTKALVETPCGCSFTAWDSTAEKTGQPEALHALQVMGKVRFEWFDQSLCEWIYCISLKRRLEQSGGRVRLLHRVGPLFL